MKAMQNIMSSKKGFTLIEMIITTLVLSILMGITLGMVTSSGKMFSSGADASIDKMVGDAVFESIESAAKYSTHLELANSKEACSKGYDQGFYIDVTDTNNKSGILKYSAKSNKAKRYPGDPYSEDFYQKRSVKYVVKPYVYTKVENGKEVKYNSGKHLTITVIVCRDGQEVYKRDNTVKCINLGLLGDGATSNLIVSADDLVEYNQYISFSSDEQLVMTEVEGYETCTNASEMLTAYNEINNVLAISLNNAYIDFPDDEAARLTAMNDAATFARAEMKELLGGYTPKNLTEDANDPARFFNGVQATKEEVFYGLLLDKFAVDGKVTPESYQKFINPEKFFEGSTFEAYCANMVQLVLYKMNDGVSFDIQSNMYVPSQILDYNVYSVRWGEWFDDWNSYKLKFFPLRIEKTIHTIDFSDPNNVFGWIDNGKRSYNNAFIMFHPQKNTWYYQPTTTTGLSPVDKKPKLYDIGDKSSTAVALDIDSNTVGEYEETITVGVGGLKFDITKVNHTSSTTWNALPAKEIGLPKG